MRGTRRIVLMEPAPTGEAGDFGQEQFGPPVPHVVHAVREPMTGGGSEGLIGRDVLGVDVGRVYRFAQDAVPKHGADGRRIVVDETWTVVDENGTELAIDAVGEANSGPRRRWLRIVCDRKTPEGRVAA